MEHQALAIRGGSQVQVTADSSLLRSLSTALQDHSPIQPSLGGRVFATESALNAEDTSAINIAASNLQATLSSVVRGLNLDGNSNASRIFATESAAVQGALCASNPQAFLQRNLSVGEGSASVHVVKAGGVPNYLGHRSRIMATEAFDNRETRSAVLYTMAYNYTASRQNEFGETIWPTLTLPADQVGFGIVVNRLAIHRGVTHTVDGKVVDFGKIDLMRAGVDPTVLHREKTRVYPVVRAAAADKFVPAAKIAPHDYNNEGVTISTAPYRTGVNIGILGLSQTDAQLDAGANNQTDTLDPAISLDNLYLEIDGDIVKVKVYTHATANFVYAPQDMDKNRNLQFRSSAITLSKNTTQADGTALVSLAGIVTGNLSVVLEVQASGVANTEYGSVEVFGNRVAISKIIDADGELVAPTTAIAQDLATKFAGAAIIGYDLRAFRTNMNMRERGDFIDRTSFTQLYEVPLLSPVTAQRPQNTDGQMDSGDFEALVTTTRFRLQNDAVTAILDAVARISEHVASGVSGQDIPYNLGAARFHVKPVCYTPPAIDVATVVDSIGSGNRLADLQSALVNIIRDFAFKMFVFSEYQSASDAMGREGPATIIVATDPYLHRYIMLDGDLRTLTEKFNIRVVSTIDKRFRGKVFLTFGIFDENRNQAPNILNWGNLVWAPEVVMSASVPRGESMSRETIVQPRYLFVNHLPVCALLEFTNLSATLSKIPVNFHTVP